MTSLLTAPTVWGLLVQRAHATPDAPLLIDGLSGQRLSAGQTLQAALGLAAWLRAQGVGPGSVVTWQLPTGLPAFVLQLALARLSAVQNPLISLYGPAETEAVLRRHRPDVFVVPQDSEGDEGSVAGRARQVLGRLEAPPRLLHLAADLPLADPATLPPEPNGGDVVRWIYVTSGTTAEPKGVCHADEALLRAGLRLAEAMDARPDDVSTIAYPIAHVGGAMNTVMLLASGGSAVLLPRYQAAEAITAFARHGVTVTGGSTAHYQALLAEQRLQPGARLLPRLRLLNGGGAPKPPELVAQVRDELGCVLAHAYGMTEAPLIAAGRASHSAEQLANSDGAVVEGMQLLVVTLDGRPAAVNEDGEIRVRGPGIFRGYTDPALNAAAFDEDGWFRTGDLGRLRLDGHLAVTGRLKDVIIRKGENISAREVEDLLSRHPKVAAVAVIGLPDAERGERVCAVVELRHVADTLDFGEMVAWFEAAGVMRQKIPEQLEVVDTLPRISALNKVSKTELRRRYASGPTR
ncbi:MAG: AMP-binding protein [Rubrivivax sp.]|nr:AMP-binding protein [Rubrivivax sp.]